MQSAQPKLKVAVLYGGRSGEHEVSLRSAAAVIQHLDSTRFEIVPIGIDKRGHWHLNDLQQLRAAATPALPITTARTRALMSPNAITGKGIAESVNEQALSLFDVVFPVMHGSFCEDGTLQGLLELADVPYVGAGVLASAVAMDKDFTKRLITAAGMQTAPYVLCKQAHWERAPAEILEQIERTLTYPIFVKPANAGSSVGIHKVRAAEQLTTALQDAFLYDAKVIIEQGLAVRELELAVLENPIYGQPPLVSIAGEILPSEQHGFYSYAAKYLDEQGAALMIPATLSAEQLQTAQQLAAQIFELLDCEGMARVDLFLEQRTGQFYFNELNTLPGFTSISMYPKLWTASGLAYSELLTRLIELALARHQRKQNLKRDWALPTETH